MKNDKAGSQINLQALVSPWAGRSSARGFSLIELLLVLSIVVLLASIAVPNLMKARRAANEASAVSSLKLIAGGQLVYRQTQGQFTTLTCLSQESIIDNMLGTGFKSGYVFDSTPGGQPSEEYTTTATPSVPSGVAASGLRYYFVMQDNVLRYNLAGPADSSSNPLN
ncbi:MAG: prepilin-type N-terminal cleavage/methylation domain-containing protein [Terriglobia bacterium]